MNDWVPVKASLPLENGDYLVTDEIVLDKYSSLRSIKIAYYHIEFGWLVHDADNCIKGKVIAWKVLPTVYNGD